MRAPVAIRAARVLAGSFCFLSLCLLLAADEPAAPVKKEGPSGSFVGVVTGAPRSARIAFVLEYGKFQCYLCSQDADFNSTHSRWFEGQLDAKGAFKVTAGGMELRGTLKGKQVSGDIIGADRKWLSFAADLVPVGGDAGLYRSEAKLEGEEYVAGWIVDQDDNVAGAVIRRQAKQIVTPQPGKAGANLSPKAPALPKNVVNQLGATGNIAKLNGLSPNKQGPKQVVLKNPVVPKLVPKNVAVEPVVKKSPPKIDIPVVPKKELPVVKDPLLKDAPPLKKDNPPLPKKELPVVKDPPLGKQPNDPVVDNPNPPIKVNQPINPLPKLGKQPGKDVPPVNDQPPVENPPPEVGPMPQPKPIKVLPGKEMPIKVMPGKEKPIVNPPNQNVPPVNDPAAVETPAPAEPVVEEVKQTKIDDAVREENEQSRAARFQAKGGSPYFAGFMHQVRRFLAGAEPSGAVETRANESLASVPKEALQQLVERFDQLPEADRKALLGPVGEALTPDTSLENAALDQIRDAVKAQSPKKPPRGAGPADGGVKKVSIGKLNCIRETPPSGVGSDDVLLVHLAASGKNFSVKVSEPIRGIDTGTNRAIAAIDGSIWPIGEEELAAKEEISILVGVLEDDSGKPEETTAILRACGECARAISENISAGLLDFDLTDAMADAFDALAAALPSADFLGTDKGIVQTDGKLTSVKNVAKTKFSVQQKGSAGKLKSQYDLSEVKIEK